MNNFELLRQLRNKGKPQRNKGGPSSIKCKSCGANESQFVNNNESGNSICTKCGVIQSERKLIHYNNRVENGKVLYARVLVEEDQKIKLLVNIFFNELFTDLKSENRAGFAVAQIYKELKVYKAGANKSNIQSAFKGLHMPTIVCCILYCTLIQEGRGMPLSIIVVTMNKALSKSRTKTTLVNLQTVYNYRTQAKYKFAMFFKLNKMQCYNHQLNPSDFILFTSNTILRLQDAQIKKSLNIIADEIFKEYPDTTSPALIATGTLFTIGNKFNTYDFKQFGLKKKELNDIKNKIESSKNRKIIEILELINSFVN